MDEDINQKYRIMELPLEGKIAEVGELIPYRSGNGFFRNVVLAMPGVLDTPAYAPVTMFGTDAADLDPQLDLERPVKCTARLTSRRYLDRSGNVRWAMSLTVSSMVLGPRKVMDPPDRQQENPGPDAPGEPGTDDIPF